MIFANDELWSILLKDGGILAFAIVMFFTIRAATVFIKVVKGKNGKSENRQEKSGDVTPEVWGAKIERIVREQLEKELDRATESLMKDIRNLMEVRTGILGKEIVKPILDAIDKNRDTLRGAIASGIARMEIEIRHARRDEE